MKKFTKLHKLFDGRWFQMFIRGFSVDICKYNIVEDHKPLGDEPHSRNIWLVQMHFWDFDDPKNCTLILLPGFSGNFKGNLLRIYSKLFNVVYNWFLESHSGCQFVWCSIVTWMNGWMVGKRKMIKRTCQNISKSYESFLPYRLC